MKLIENFLFKIKQTIGECNKEETSYDYHQWLLSLSKMVSSELGSLNKENAKESLKPNDTLTMVLLFDKGHFSHEMLEKKSDMELYMFACENDYNTKIYTAKGYEQMLNSFKPKDTYVWTYIVNVNKEMVDNSRKIEQ